MRINPNPGNGDLVVRYYLKKTVNLQLTINDVNGKLLENRTLRNQIVGEHVYTPKIKNRGVYFLTIKTPYETATRKIIFN